MLGQFSQNVDILKIILTCNTAQKSQIGRITGILINHAFASRAGKRNSQCYGLVEFASSRFNCDNWTDGHSISQQTSHNVRWNNVSLYADFYFLRQSAFREEGLHVVLHGGGDDSAVWTDCVHFLSDAGDNGKVQRKVGGQNSHNPIGLKIFDGAQF
jgi:hypothetical protein